MDEDDSQDEPISCSTSHRRGKRAALWSISDDSDDTEAESENGQSDSGDEGDDDPGNEDDENEEDEDDDEEEEEEEEEEAKPHDGGGMSADFTGISSDEDSEKCPICLNSFTEQPVATPENCEHYFCFDCILEWTKNANSCPVDRTAFNSIYIRQCYGGKVKKMVTVQKPAQKNQEDAVDLDLEQTNCEVCGGSDREDRLLLCDGCDAGYHMECLTPPLDSVPVEEWFCPECEANNQSSRSSAEDLSDGGSVPSAARPATSRALPRGPGPTRAIARTQQSERVRANVNRHRISQLAPTYLMQSTWLDETINAVVAGLNTAVYVRDVAPRVASRRRRRTVKRRKVKRKKTSAGGKMSSTGVQRRKRRSRKTKSKKKLTHKKSANPRSRIASNLGIVKDKKSSSLPTVYRPSESTLSSMRADIGAASLSIYGDPFDLDPFVDQENHEQRAHVSSLLEARRRGLSRSALRSHHPVARPVAAPFPSRGADHSQTEAASVPDLLGSILSGQSMLLMDSSDVIINRDGSLKATKPDPIFLGLSSGVTASGMMSSSDASALISPGVSSNEEDLSVVYPSAGPLPEPLRSSTNRAWAHRSTNCPSFTSSQSALSFTAAASDSPSRGTPAFLAPHQNRSGPLKSPENSCVDFTVPSQAHAKRAAVKPMWVDVSELPRIPKIKRKSHEGPDASRPAGILSVGLNRPSGDKGKNQSEDQQKDNWTHRHRSERDGSFSSSFSSSGSSASQPQCPPSSSSAVSFRINSSGNSWHARRLNIGCSSGENLEDVRRRKEDEAKRRLLIRDKQMLLASRTPTSRGQESDIYDPCNPTTSDSGSSADETESKRSDCKREGPSWGNRDEMRLSMHDVQVKTEKQEMQISQVKMGSPQKSRSQAFPGEPPKIKEEPSAGVKAEHPHLHTGAKLEEAMENSGHHDLTKKEESRCFSGPPRSRSINHEDSPTTSQTVAKSKPQKGSAESQSSLCLKPESSRRTDPGAKKDNHEDTTRKPRDGGRSFPSMSSDQTERRRFGSLSTDSRRKSPPRSASSSSGKKSHESKNRDGNDGRRSEPASSHRKHGPANPTSSSGSKHEDSKRPSTSREREREYAREKHTSLTSKERGGKERRRSRSRERREGGSSRSTQKNCSSSSRHSDFAERKRKDSSHGDVQLQDHRHAPFTSCPVKNDRRDSGGEMKDAGEDTQPENDVKKEKHILNEQILTSFPVLNKNETNVKKEQAESPETVGIKSEQSSPELCPTPPAASLPDSVPAAAGQSQPQPRSSVDQDVPDVPDAPEDPDSDNDVDLMLDCPDFVKPEPVEAVKQEEEGEAFKDEGEPVSVAAVPKTKTQVKRVTWNIQEPEGPQPEKSSSKLALYKLKLKQEGVRRSSMVAQTSAQETKGTSTDSVRKDALGSVGSSSISDDSSGPSNQQGESSGEGDGLLRKDKYLKKLHMQERAIEEVKLAIKPFYQRRDIDKDEYKEILRKAVQKVCHSKSGEINPVKVGNLVKAYVDKYKHARKRRKEAVLGEQTEPIGASESP
ncbi:PHD and RING finger domain-containing protein 1 isoform X4 [Oryzias melastigma]|uniref:PHD and RING finger domain-containing protein 1 isoform X4 n=1 Tax=Oryzias melastigma TaxID=30732 RepID=UPI00168CE26A|nr:PHD and RING finger domain-containing protein 1 isoform X4 [Oryzias melastigma]